MVSRNKSETNSPARVVNRSLLKKKNDRGSMEFRILSWWEWFSSSREILFTGCTEHRFDGLYFTRPLCRGGNNTAQLPWISSSRKKGNKISIKRATKWRRQTFNESTSGLGKKERHEGIEEVEDWREGRRRGEPLN